MITMMRRFNYSTQKSNAKGQITQVFSVSLLTVFIYLFIYLLLLFVSGVILETYRQSWAAALHDKTSWLLAWSGRVPLWGFESTTYPIVQYWKVPRLKNLSNLSTCPSRYQPCCQNMSLPSLTPFQHRALCWEMWCIFLLLLFQRTKLSYLLLIKVLNTHAVNAGAIFPGLIGLQSKHTCRMSATGAVQSVLFFLTQTRKLVVLKNNNNINKDTLVSTHLLHCQFMNVNFQLAVRQRQDDAGGLGALSPYLLRGLQMKTFFQ